MIQIAEKQGRKTLELKEATLVYVGEEQKGTSSRTGNDWKVRSANIRFSLGTDAAGKEETMLLTAKCLNGVCERIGMTAIGSKFHAFVEFDVNTRFRYPHTECTLVDFTL